MESRIHSMFFFNVLSFINKKDTGMMTVSVMAEDTIRKTYLLSRGVYDKPTGDPLTASAVPNYITGTTFSTDVTVKSGKVAKDQEKIKTVKI